MRRALLLALGLFALTLAAAAQDGAPHKQLEPFVPATPGQKACYTQRFDAKYLAAHPKQRVTQVSFLLRATGYGDDGMPVLDPAAKFERVDYQFTIAITLRGGKPMMGSGFCGDGEGNAAPWCNRMEDGGGVTLTPVAGSDALTLRVSDGGIRFGKTSIKPASADDKTFRVEKVPAAQCAALEPSLKEEFGK